MKSAQLALLCANCIDLSSKILLLQLLASAQLLHRLFGLLIFFIVLKRSNKELILQFSHPSASGHQLLKNDAFDLRPDVLQLFVDNLNNFLRVDCSHYLLLIFLILHLPRIVNSKLINIIAKPHRLSHCQIIDILFIAVDDLPDPTGVSCHHILKRELLIQ